MIFRYECCFFLLLLLLLFSFVLSGSQLTCAKRCYLIKHEIEKQKKVAACSGFGCLYLEAVTDEGRVRFLDVIFAAIVE
jgi:hypothetical protein